MDDANLTFADAAHRLVIDTPQEVRFAAGVNVTPDMVGEIEFHGDVTFDLVHSQRTLKLSELAFVGSDEANSPYALTVNEEALILGTNTKLGIDKNLKVDFNSMGGIDTIPRLYLGENHDTTLSFDDNTVLTATELVAGSLGRRTVIDGSLHLGTGGAPFTQGLIVKESITVNGNTTVNGDLSGGDGTLHFNIPQSAVANSVLLTVNGDADIRGSTVILDSPTGRPAIIRDTTIILMDVSGTLTADPVLTVVNNSGDTYTVRINELDDTQLIAILKDLSPTSPLYARLKAYAESRAAGLAFVNQGMDVILNRGFASAMAATAGTGRRVNAFGGASGGWSRYRSGSHADVAGVSALAGLAIGSDTANGRATAAAFFETGWGDYDTHNSFAGLASVAGKGNTTYTGGGVLVRHDVTGGALAGLSVEASARIGRTKTDFRTEDINYSGWNAAFDSDSLYYSLHAGASYAKPLTDKATLDLSAKLLWTRQESDDVTVHQDAVHFDKADSLRTRIGARYAYALTDCLTPYAGASWEHEFDGEFRSTVNGNRIAPPSLQGDTAMGELGLTYRRDAFTVDAAVQAYLGKRQGVSGSLHLGWAF